jgi:hypothetical protein
VVIDGSTMLISWGNAVPPNLTGRVDSGQRVYRVPITGRDDISVWGTSASLRTADLWRFYYSYRTLYLLTTSVGVALQNPRTAPPMAAIFISKCEPT